MEKNAGLYLSTAEINQLLCKIILFQQAFLPGLQVRGVVRLPFGARMPGRAEVAYTVPGQKEGAPGFGPRCRLAGEKKVEKGRKLVQMSILSLSVDLPEEGAAGPLGTHEGVLTAYKIEVTAAQQGVVIVLPEKGNRLGTQGAAFPYVAIANMGAHRGKRLSRRHQQAHWPCPGGQRVEQGGDRGALVTEQAGRPFRVG